MVRAESTPALARESATRRVSGFNSRKGAEFCLGTTGRAAKKKKKGKQKRVKDCKKLATKHNLHYLLLWAAKAFVDLIGKFSESSRGDPEPLRAE